MAVLCAGVRKAAKRSLGWTRWYPAVFGPLSHWVVRVREPGGTELSLRPFSNDPWIVREVCGARVYERGPVPEPGMTVFVVGAHVGTFTTRVSRLVGPRGRVFAFEPVPENRGLLLENLRRNGCGNVIVLPQAVSSEAGLRLFRATRTGATGGNAMQAASAGTPDGLRSENIVVECVTLDGVAEGFALPSVDFLKIDVEGHELEVLRGSARLLADFHPRICLESDPRGRVRAEVAAFLQTLGYATASPPAMPWILYGEPQAGRWSRGRALPPWRPRPTSVP